MNSVTGAQNIDAGVAFLRDGDTRAPGQRSFPGLTASGNRSKGDFGILGLWDTLEDLEASDSAVSKLGKEAIAALGGQMLAASLSGDLLAALPDHGSAELRGRPCLHSNHARCLIPNPGVLAMRSARSVVARHCG